jgi:Flp pilus assembly protein TadG
MVRKRLNAGAEAFQRDEQGATAVEFAFVAPILAFAVISLIQLGVLGMMITNVDAAVGEASRMIRTGQDGAATTAQQFEDQICAKIGGDIGDCRARTEIGVRTYPSFAAANAQANAAPDGSYTKGGPGDIVVVKVSYRWPAIMPYPGEGVGHDGPTELIIPARAAFKNEPYG